MTTILRNGAQSAIDATPGDDVPAFRPFFEFGAAGLKRTSGYINDEFLPALSGRKAARIYREISDNSPIIGGWYLAVTQLMNQLEWRVEVEDNSSEGKRAARHVEQCMDDMAMPWGDAVIDICSFLQYGYHLAEVMYKRRKGPWVRGRDNSKHEDGLIGWYGLHGRAQESIMRWVFGPNDEILAAVQQAAPRYEKRVLPIASGKVLLFRTTISKNNPEGRSLLRNVYEPWYYLKRHQEIEAIGVSRDLAGMPMAKVPSKILEAVPGTKDGDMLDAIKRLVTSIARNEKEGIVWPHDVDPDTKAALMEFELLSSGGSRQFDTEGIINRYKTEMLQALVSDWLQVGHEENGGAYNMHVDKLGIFRVMVNGYANRIADQMNRVAIPELFRLNNWKPKVLPRIVPNRVDPPDLTVLGAFMAQTASLGIQWFPDPVMEKFLRDAAGLPQLDKRTEDALEQQRRQAVVIGAAQQKMQALQMDQQVTQGQLGVQQQAIGVAQQQQELTQGPAAGKDAQDPNDAKRSGIAVQSDKVKLDQEKQKLKNLKDKKPAPTRPASKLSRPASSGKSGGGRAPVKKVYTHRVLVPVKEVA